MKNVIAGLLLALVMLVVPTFGQTTQTPNTPETKLPFSLVVNISTDDPQVTPAVQALADALKTDLGDGFAVSSTKPEQDDPTQYVILISAFGSTTVDKDGKAIPTNIMLVAGFVHVKGHVLPFYLFSVPIQLDSISQVPELEGGIMAVLGRADASIGDLGGVDKL